VQLLSVNTGVVAPLQVGRRVFSSAMGKRARDGVVALGPLGLDGDEQADPSVHGGLAKAVYAYPVEHLPFWKAQRQRGGVCLFEEELPPGFLGENLSIRGLLETDTWIGDRLVFPHAVLRVTAPREPCFKFNTVMELPDAGRLMMEGLCSGFYLAVEQAGSLSAGQHFELVPGPRGLRVSETFAARRLKHLR